MNTLEELLGIDPDSPSMRRAAQLETVGGDEGVQRHVLRLEGRGMVAILEEDATERGGDHALADVAARTREHDGAKGGMHWNHV